MWKIVTWMDWVRWSLWITQYQFVDADRVELKAKEVLLLIELRCLSY